MGFNVCRRGVVVGRSVAAGFIAVLCVANGSSTVARAEDVAVEADVELQISEFLANHPDVVQYGERTVGSADGSVVMDFDFQSGTDEDASSLTAAQRHGCTAGWYCLFEHIDFNRDRSGRRLRFQACSAGGSVNDLARWNFTNKASSWVNDLSRGSVWARDGRNDLFEITSQATGADVRDTCEFIYPWFGDCNDKADSLICRW